MWVQEIRITPSRFAWQALCPLSYLSDLIYLLAWFAPIIPALESVWQEDSNEFKTNLG